MDEILKLDTKNSLFFSHYDPSTVEFLASYKNNWLFSIKDLIITIFKKSSILWYFNII